ncbi:MAG: NUDIX domain-containing protein [Rhodobacteraceae bacterium]|nr:NUDIX domain-containing protein [Paracoccaceae bacterium]
MTNLMTQAWEEVLKPMFFRPRRVQVAALCYRKTGTDLDVLMVTSRDTGRWIIPKGWPIPGKDGAQSALQEAWEEAGVTAGALQDDPIGTYDYVKRHNDRPDEPIETYVFKVEVDDLAADYPEAGSRKRQWMKPDEAANLVHEPQLKDLLRGL